MFEGDPAPSSVALAARQERERRQPSDQGSSVFLGEVFGLRQVVDDSSKRGAVEFARLQQPHLQGQLPHQEAEPGAGEHRSDMPIREFRQPIPFQVLLDDFPEQVASPSEVRRARRQFRRSREEERPSSELRALPGEQASQAPGHRIPLAAGQGLRGRPPFDEPGLLLFGPAAQPDRNLPPPGALVAPHFRCPRDELLLVVGRTGRRQYAPFALHRIEKSGDRSEGVVVTADAQQFIEAVHDRDDQPFAGEGSHRVTGEGRPQFPECQRQRFVEPGE